MQSAKLAAVSAKTQLAANMHWSMLDGSNKDGMHMVCIWHSHSGHLFIQLLTFKNTKFILLIYLVTYNPHMSHSVDSPTDLQPTQESFWKFKIPEHKLEVPVLVVGHVSEPRVAFDRPSLSFGQVLVGGRTHATLNLLNSEHMPFQFELDKASYNASPALLESTGMVPSACQPSCCSCTLAYSVNKSINRSWFTDHCLGPVVCGLHHQA